VWGGGGGGSVKEIESEGVVRVEGLGLVADVAGDVDVASMALNVRSSKRSGGVYVVELEEEGHPEPLKEEDIVVLEAEEMVMAEDVVGGSSVRSSVCLLPSEERDSVTTLAESAVGVKETNATETQEENVHFTLERMDTLKSLAGKNPNRNIGRSETVMTTEQKFELPENEAPLAEMVWARGDLIGAGSFGKVYFGVELDALGMRKRVMAVKQVELIPVKKRKMADGMDKGNDNKNLSESKEDSGKVARQKMVDALRMEILLLRELDHENIVQYLGSYILIYFHQSHTNFVYRI
jgi:hypothetical protein